MLDTDLQQRFDLVRIVELASGVAGAVEQKEPWFRPLPEMATKILGIDRP